MRFLWIAGMGALCLTQAVGQSAQAFVIAPVARRIHALSVAPSGVRTGIAPARAGVILAGQIAATLTAAIVGISRSRRRQHATALQGLKDRVKKDFSTKSAMIRKLGKLVLQREFDMRTQIMEDPKLALRTGMTQEELLADFERAVRFLREELGCNALESDICISKVATGLHMQHLGRPKLPTDEEMLIVFDWLTSNLKVRKDDGSLRTVVEKYPFVLGRSIEELNESRRFCPPDIDYDVAVAEDPALVDKTYNCDGICANMCTACWYNG